MFDSHMSLMPAVLDSTDTTVFPTKQNLVAGGKHCSKYMLHVLLIIFPSQVRNWVVELKTT